MKTNLQDVRLTAAGRRQQWPAAMALLLLAAVALLWARPAASAQVQRLQLLDRGDHTAAVFHLSARTEYTLFQLQNPDRVVLDFEDSSLASGLDLPAGAGGIIDVRSGRRAHHGLRVVLDMRSAVRSRSFLKSLGRDGYRLTVDLYPAGHADAAPSLAARARPVVVAIDAGHGGKDPGSIGPDGTYEKTITLAVARKLAKVIDKQPGMKAVLTRDDDRFIRLKKRYQIAREHNADLFISVHADSYTSSDAKGSSVWVLSPRGKTSEAARWLADRENRADLVGGVSLDDKPDTLAAVLLDLSQGATMQISERVARNVLHALAQIGPTHRGHVEHANFVVLRSPDVPSILVETAFISNPREERKLEDPRHQQALAKAILHGVKSYFESAPPPGTWFAARARARGDKHVVARGETLSAIARDYGVSMRSLREANSLSDIDDLRAGSVLMIPAG
ncbi:MAG TPA: N-acetylmuramoyl-L-alanine amidase [Rhodanobacteraceae bacterium]|nr:N-acetylmuramoyl-L-alanine amidase [Rhodanobacteraceae bacterium]